MPKLQVDPFHFELGLLLIRVRWSLGGTVEQGRGRVCEGRALKDGVPRGLSKLFLYLSMGSIHKFNEIVSNTCYVPYLAIAPVILR